MSRITADEARALLEGTTPGPWRIEGSIGDDVPAIVSDDAEALVTELCEDATAEDVALMIAAPDLAATVITQAEEIERLSLMLARAHHVVREYGPRCAHPQCDRLAPLRCDDCGERFCDVHDEGGEGHGEAITDRHAVGPDDLMAGAAMREAEAAR